MSQHRLMQKNYMMQFLIDVTYASPICYIIRTVVRFLRLQRHFCRYVNYVALRVLRLVSG